MHPSFLSPSLFGSQQWLPGPFHLLGNYDDQVAGHGGLRHVPEVGSEIDVPIDIVGALKHLQKCMAVEAFQIALPKLSFIFQS